LSKAYVEVKNLNSFKTVEKAIKYEVARMIELWEEGREGEIVKETRGWDEAKQKTVSQRKKESSEDYRYFPDPDLPKMKLHEAFDLEKMKSELPELPEGKRARYRNDFGIKDEDIETYINDIELDKYFTEVVYNLLPDKKLIALASNFISNDLLGSGKSVVDFIEPKLLAETVIMVSKNELSSRAAKDIILQVAKGFLAGKTIREHAEENNLLQQNDEGALKEIVQKTIDANPEVVATYKGGKENAIMSLVGKIIKETGGAANPQIVIKLLKELIV
ncbi:MAG: Asp-tRNA(Asn)/Glu-tRNA(Gln) amidotransferase subunit GatB, partial [Candidatus Paceibacteria bacterium]